MRRVCLILIALAVACGADGVLTASEAVDAFVKAGLEAPNPRDVSEEECRVDTCVEAVATDVVTVQRWAEAQAAYVYSQELEQPAYALENFVIVFPVDTDVETNAYAEALADAVREARS